MGFFQSVAISLVSTLRILFSVAFCHLLIYDQTIKQAIVFTNTIQFPLVLSDTILCFSKRPPGALLVCKRKIFGDSGRICFLKWKVSYSHVETRGDIWVSHVRWNYLQKDAITGMDSYNRRILVGVNTVLHFFFNWKCTTMCSELQVIQRYLKQHK